MGISLGGIVQDYKTTKQLAYLVLESPACRVERLVHSPKHEPKRQSARQIPNLAGVGVEQAPRPWKEGRRGQALRAALKSDGLPLNVLRQRDFNRGISGRCSERHDWYCLQQCACPRRARIEHVGKSSSGSGRRPRGISCRTLARGHDRRPERQQLLHGQDCQCHHRPSMHAAPRRFSIFARTVCRSMRRHLCPWHRSPPSSTAPRCCAAARTAQGAQKSSAHPGISVARQAGALLAVLCVGRDSPRKILCVAPNPVSYTYDAVARSWGQTRQRREGEEPPALDCLRVAMPSVAQTMKAKVCRAPLAGPTRVDSWGAPCWWGGWESGRAQCCARMRCVHAIATRRGGVRGTPPTEVLTCTP